MFIDTCKRGTPAGKIKNLSKTLKHLVLLKINDTPITKVEQVQQFFQQHDPTKTVTLLVGLTERRAMHDSAGIPMMYFDQLVTIS